MDKLITLEAEIVADAKLIVEGAAEVKIDASESITLEIAPDTYVLGSIGSFNTAGSWVGNYVNELVRESIGTGGTLADALLNIKDYVMDQIEIGVNQVITEVENTYVSSSTLTTTLGSAIAGVNSTILDVQNTYATKDEAQTYAVDAIKASFGGDADSSAIEAYIGNIAVTKVDANSATASTVATLIASMNNQTVRIDEMDEVLITTEGWAASASKLITAPDGSVTGWSFGDGSNIQSYFKIKATNFSISDGTTGYVPFSITGSQIAFNGLVSFANTTGTPTHENGTVSPTLGITTSVEGSTYYNTTTKEGFIVSSGRWIGNSSVTDTSSLALKDMSNVTTIDGGKITTGKIQSATGTTYFDLTNNQIKMNNGNFILNSTATGVMGDPHIKGGLIEGGILYNTGGTPTSYTMKIDLVVGGIYIK